jgi:hypothetical protein
MSVASLKVFILSSFGFSMFFLITRLLEHLPLLIFSDFHLTWQSIWLLTDRLYVKEERAAISLLGESGDLNIM